MKDAHLKLKAHALRERGLTLDEITQRLQLPRTTVYSWIRHLPIERTRRQRMREKAEP